MKKDNNNSKSDFPYFLTRISKTWKITLSLMGGILVIVNFIKMVLEIPIIPVWTVVWNNSSNLLHKLQDLKYAFAAQYNSTDLFVISSLTVTWGFMGICCGILAVKYKRAHSDGLKTDGQRLLKPRWQKWLLPQKRTRKIITVFIAFFVLYMMGTTSLMMDCYFRLCQFQRACTIIRPFISDHEYYSLNRAWVTMTSKADYLKLKNQFNLYQKRIEMYSNIEDTQPIRNGYVIVGGEQ